MTWIINSSLVHMYTKSMMLIEEIPDIPVRAAEACPCHRDLFPHLTDYRRRQLFEKQYGQGTFACPMAGELVPELVRGMLHDACVGTWALQETTLFSAPWEGSAPLSPEDWKVVLDDFYEGKTKRSRVSLLARS